MKNQSKFLLLLAGLFLAGSSMAAERDHRMDRNHQRGDAGVGTQAIEHLTRAIRHLDLSDEQKDAIHAELKGLRESVKPLAREVHEGRKALHGLITEEFYDAEAIAVIARNQGDLTTEITMMVSGAASAVLAQLSEEQRMELERMREERSAHRPERHEKDGKQRKEHAESS